MRRARWPVLAVMLIAVLAAVVLLSPQASPARAEQEKIDPLLQEQAAANPEAMLAIIVELTHATAPFEPSANEQRARRAVEILTELRNDEFVVDGIRLVPMDGFPVGGLPIVNGAAGFATSKGLDRLAAHDEVVFVHADAAIGPRGADSDPPGTYPPGQLSAPYPRVVRADKVWLDGVLGRGVTVAVLDSGIAPHADLTMPANRILASVNFAGDTCGVPDRGGHGTHVAGIIAGNGSDSDLSNEDPTLEGDADQIEYVGVAPAAGLVDVRVLGCGGTGRVSSVVRGIEWVIDHRAEYNIRVINLSFGGPPRHSYRVDPLTASAEVAWKRGIVVVAASGNAGPEGGTVDTPGVDPYLVTVGALDDRATLKRTDDELAWFSAWGTPTDSRPRPDLVAPGRRIVSLRVPGSYLDELFPDRVVTAKSGADYFRLTGTSMSTGVVSGVVALMLERTPSLTPDEVKAILVATVQPYGQESKTPLPDPSADGAGLVDAWTAVKSGSVGLANRDLRPANSFARVLYPALYELPLSWKDPNFAGQDWESYTWENLAWDNLAWDNLAWDNLAWDNLAWDNLAWDNLAWDNLAWDSGPEQSNLAWDALATLD
jgi:subtilisin family serine protease